MYLFYSVFFIAAEELLKKIEAEKNAQMDEAIPLGNDAASFGNKAGSSGKKGKFKTYGNTVNLKIFYSENNFIS